MTTAVSISRYNDTSLYCTILCHREDVFSQILNDVWGSHEKHPDRNGLYIVIIHPRFIHYFTLRQAASIRIGFPHLPFVYVYEHFGGNGKCREFAEVPRHKAHAVESKSNLRCLRCIKNSFRLRRLTPSSFAASEMTKGRKEGRKRIAKCEYTVSFSPDT